MSTSAPFGRPRRELPETGAVTLKLRIPVGTARLIYDQANTERRHLGSIAAEAFAEFYANHPPETWRSVE